MHRVAECYEAGYGVVKNLKKAFHWLHKAVSLGDFSAMYSISDCYKFGKGVKRNMREAISWYRKAGEALEKFERL
jgi:TPR repeat protein